MFNETIKKYPAHPHESSGQFQGDMKLTPHQWEVLNGNQDRNGVVNTWRWSTPTIPYIINPEFNETQVELILSAMRHIENGTCMRFVERVNQFGFIIIAVRKYTFQFVSRYTEVIFFRVLKQDVGPV